MLLLQQHAQYIKIHSPYVPCTKLRTQWGKVRCARDQSEVAAGPDRTGKSCSGPNSSVAFVGADVGASVGAAVAFVGATVGTLDGDADGTFVGDMVGDCVGTTVGTSVGA